MYIVGNLPIKRAKHLDASYTIDIVIETAHYQQAGPYFIARPVNSRMYGEAADGIDLSAQLVSGTTYRLTLPTLAAGQYIIQSHNGNYIVESTPLFIYDIDVEVHVADLGWVNMDCSTIDNKLYYNNGAHRVEAFIINVEGLPDYIKVIGQAHMQDYGWLAEVGNGEVIGKPNENKRLEAFKLRFYNEKTGQTIPNMIHYSANTNPNDLPFSYIQGQDGAIVGTTGSQLPLYQPEIDLL